LRAQEQSDSAEQDKKLVNTGGEPAIFQHIIEEVEQREEREKGSEDTGAGSRAFIITR
jgi:organic radical activating enzyme